MADKILFVDDEPAILDGYRRMLHREFEVDTATGGEDGLALVRGAGPYAVVVSDMRMPGMNGAKFLAEVRQLVPETVRMLLTGYSDMDAAIDAVNEGNIFRYLTKPCEKEDLVKAINLSLEKNNCLSRRPNSWSAPLRMAMPRKSASGIMARAPQVCLVRPRPGVSSPRSSESTSNPM